MKKLICKIFGHKIKEYKIPIKANCACGCYSDKSTLYHICIRCYKVVKEEIVTDSYIIIKE
jgi:hypothetical protein